MLKKISLLFLLLPSISFADEIVEASCADLLALLNRPSVLDSPCSVEPGNVVIEVGYQYLELHSIDGHSQNFPEAVIRFGLPNRNEFLVVAPNYIHENPDHEDVITGSSATSMAFKHQFPIYNSLIYALEAYATPPSGNDNFGTDEWGTTLNAIASYNFTDSFSATLMLGFSSEITAPNDGSERFNSFNPDIVFAWKIAEMTQLYVEFYGQTKTGPDENSGYNGDGGIQYLITDNIEVDLEYGWRMSGDLEGYSHYIGFGGGVRF